MSSVNSFGTRTTLSIGGPNLLLKDARGIAVDPKSKDVIVSDKTLNAVFRFHVPEAFGRLHFAR